ncbi:uncharacterized protein METZ01_LOCUS312887, partial [marine metagenome]
PVRPGGRTAVGPRPVPGPPGGRGAVRRIRDGVAGGPLRPATLDDQPLPGVHRQPPGPRVRRDPSRSPASGPRPGVHGRRPEVRDERLTAAEGHEPRHLDPRIRGGRRPGGRQPVPQAQPPQGTTCGDAATGPGGTGPAPRRHRPALPDLRPHRDRDRGALRGDRRPTPGEPQPGAAHAEDHRATRRVGRQAPAGRTQDRLVGADHQAPPVPGPRTRGTDPRTLHARLRVPLRGGRPDPQVQLQPPPLAARTPPGRPRGHAVPLAPPLLRSPARRSGRPPQVGAVPARAQFDPYDDGPVRVRDARTRRPARRTPRRGPQRSPCAPGAPQGDQRL